jgi:hypothetical protein
LNYCYENECVVGSKFFVEKIENLGNRILNYQKRYWTCTYQFKKEETNAPVYWCSQLLSRHVVSQKWASSKVPLTSLTSNKVKFEWHSFHQQAIDKIKKVIRTELLLCYLDFSKPFHLDTDASDHQLEAVIMQNKSPWPFIRKSSIQLKSVIQPLREIESCYHLLKSANNTWISCLDAIYSWYSLQSISKIHSINHNQ